MSESTFENQLEQNMLEEHDDERLSADFLTELRSFMDETEVKDLNISMEEGFRITSREQAGFFIRKLQEVRAEAEQINATADGELQRLSHRVNVWKEKELKKLDGSMTYLIDLLRSFAETELEGTNKRSISLPFGTLGFKKQQDKYEYDDAQLLTFLEQQKLEAYIQRKPSAKKADLKKNGVVKDGKLYIDGVEVPGITIITQDDAFDVK